MNGYQPGIRVGAILSADKEEVRLLGYGVYEGMFEPPIGPFGTPWEEYERLALNAFGQEMFERKRAEGTLRPANPRIRLDNGSVVWGQQCWWGPEDRVRELIGTRRVVMVGIDEG